MGFTGRRSCGWRLGVSIAARGTSLNNPPVFTLRGVSKTYFGGGTEFKLSVPHLDIQRGCKLAFIGESGSGKSTLLELLCMLLQPTEYESIQFVPDANANGYDIGAYWREGATDLLTDLRSRYIGYVLQTGGLLPYLTVRENINLSRRLLHLPLDGKADSLAEKLGIADQLDKLPAMLSVGQRQRAAVARALAHQPVILIADEPTAAVDPINAERIVALLAGLADELGVTLLIATHAHALVQRLGLTLVEHGIQADQDTRMIVTVPPV